MSRVTRSRDVSSKAVGSVEGLPTRGNVSMKPMMRGDLMIMIEISYPTGAGSPIHAHQHESVVYVVEGVVKVVIGEERHTLRSGDVCIHPEGVPHSIEAIEAATILEIKSPPQPLEQFLGTVRQSPLPTRSE